MTARAEAFMGLGVDHLYATCPILTRELPELERWDRDFTHPHRFLAPVDPYGDSLCGWCVRVWKARNRERVS